MNFKKISNLLPITHLMKLFNVGPVKSRDFATDVIIPLTVERGHNITLHCHLEGYNIQFTVS